MCEVDLRGRWQTLGAHGGIGAGGVRFADDGGALEGEDVLAHLLDTPLRKPSMAWDQAFVEKVEIRSAEDVKQLVDHINAEGVRVYRRLSAPVLRSMMELACEQSATFHEGLDPFGKAMFAVS